MKKLGLFLSLLICSILVTGCHNIQQNWENECEKEAKQILKDIDQNNVFLNIEWESNTWEHTGLNGSNDVTNKGILNFRNSENSGKIDFECSVNLDEGGASTSYGKIQLYNKNSYTGKYIALYPFGTEVEPKEPDYSWMTVQKLYNDPDIKNDIENHRGKDYYFLNSIYYKLYRDNEGKYKSEEKIVIQEDPTKEPLYFDWELLQKVRNNVDDISLDHLEGNILVTGYLETYMEPACIYCDEEEAKEYGKVEVWRIYPDDGNKYGGFVLGYTEGEHIVAMYPNIRFDDIQQFSNYNKYTKGYQVNLRDIANDGKVHTFRVVLDDGGAQERAYFGSMIRERDFIE